MPKNLGLYNDDLSTPRKKDVDNCYGPNNAPPYPVTSVNGQTGAVTLTKANVGLNNVDNVKQYSANNPPPYPVTSVNSKSGAVTLSKGDVGLGNVDNIKQYSESNPPPYPVTSVNGMTGNVTIKPKCVTVTLSSSGWDSTAKTQTAVVSGVLADETKQLITPTPAIASQTAYYNAGIRCTGQSANSLTFTAKTIPTADLTVYVTIQEVGA